MNLLYKETHLKWGKNHIKTKWSYKRVFILDVTNYYLFVDQNKFM